MQCQNTKQKINDFKQNFETFYIVLWYNDINKKNIEILSSTGKSISEGNNINSVVVYKMHDDNYPWMLPYSDEDSFMTIWMKFYYNIPQETELVWVDYEK